MQLSIYSCDSLCHDVEDNLELCANLLLVVHTNETVKTQGPNIII